MKERDVIIKHVKNVNKVIIRVLLVILAIHLVYVATGTYVKLNSIRSVMLTILIILTTVVSKSKYYNFSKYINTLGIMIFALTYYDFLVMSIWLMVGVVSLAGLYFDRKLSKFIFISANICELIIQFTAINTDGIAFVTCVAALNLIMIVIFSSTKISSSLIEQSILDADRSQELLNKIENTMEIVEKNTLSLDESITVNNRNIHVIINTSNDITNTIKETALGAERQVKGLSKMKEIMDESNIKFNNAYEGTKNSNIISQDSRKVVYESECVVKNMNDQMNNISKAVSDSKEGVNELIDSNKKVENLLLSIESIAEQINLLALNASIEAARAGEVGKGFSVVAEEVRKLAEESSKVVSEVDFVLGDIRKLTVEVLKQVENVEDVSNKGIDTALQVEKTFVTLDKSFRLIESHLSGSSENIEIVRDLFESVINESEEVLKISNEQYLSAEKSLEITEDQNEKIVEISNEISEISNLSKNLREIMSK